MNDKNMLMDQLKVLAEPRRFRILDLLMEGTHCNCEFVEKLQMTPNLISHHLSVLKEAGLVDMKRDEKDARWIYYSINQEALQTLKSGFMNIFDLSRIQTRIPACKPDSDSKKPYRCKTKSK
jgi:ArsR family transcriptional regulator